MTEDAIFLSPTMGEDAAVAVYFVGQDEPSVVLLPDLGPMQTWDADQTVAEMDYEIDGIWFKFTAYSPLFMDIGDDLESRSGLTRIITRRCWRRRG